MRIVLICVRIIPEGYLHEKSFLRDLFENVATAQFHHRFFAFGTYFMALCKILGL